jgi:probable HAF family extracellular repeat protein
MTNLGVLGGSYSVATGINADGQVAGWSTTGYFSDHAFITGPDGMGMTDLGTLGRNYSEATGINAAGQVVGESQTGSFLSHAFITGHNGVGMADLNSLVDLPAGVFLTKAFAINNTGQVIVTALVPEPESYALMLAGLALMGVVVRRKQRG